MTRAHLEILDIDIQLCPGDEYSDDGLIPYMK